MKLQFKTLFFCLSIILTSDVFGQIAIPGLTSSDFAMTIVELDNEPDVLILDVLVITLVPMIEILISDSEGYNPPINKKKVKLGDKFHQIFSFPKGENPYSLMINCRAVFGDEYREDGCNVDIDGSDDGGGN